jgi:hypothetical protein
MSQSRRLAAILAADVAGDSPLMGADEAGTARMLREHRARRRSRSWPSTAAGSSRPPAMAC